MNRILILSLFLALFNINKAEALSIITGTWNRSGNVVFLYEVENGQLKEKASYIINEDGKFGFALNLTKEGYYAVGTDNNLLMTGKYIFYLKPNDNLALKIGTNEYELTGNNTDENKAMQQWFEIIKPINQMSMNSGKGKFMTYVEFFPILEEVIEKAKTWNYTKTGNKTFDTSFIEYRNFDLAVNALQFLFLARSSQPQEKDLPEYYKQLSFNRLCNSGFLMEYPFGNRLLTDIDLKVYREKRQADSTLVSGDSETLKENISNISNDILKGELVLNYARKKQSVEGLLNFQSQFSKYLITDSQKERFKNMLIEKAKNTQGEPAIDFKFQNSEGKEIALSSLKGKAVYIDVWATWCGPCKKEIPYLIKLKEEYKNKEIVFLGVSIDAQADHDKWKKFLVDNNLKGIQLFAGDKADDISKPYKIKNIPRFILIDKNGRIVSDNAPRPSNPEIKLLIDNVLLK